MQVNHMDILKQYEESCVKDGHMVFTPAGTLIRLKPGSLKPQWGEDGVFIAGLKPGFKLADFASIKKFDADQAAAKKKKLKS